MQPCSDDVLQWDLVCGKKWLIATSQSIYMAGKFAVVLVGYVSDRCVYK